MQEKRPLITAALLTWIAGFVDAVGFLSLERIYTANMSGNSVAIGIQAMSGNWPETMRRILPVAAYFIGLVFCRLLLEFGARERIRSIASVAMVIEIGFLSSLILFPGSHTKPSNGVALCYVALLALAMGIQNGALTRFSSFKLHTGFVTGTLVECAEETAKYLAWARDELCLRGRSLADVAARSRGQKAFRLSVWLASIWLAYVAGAACGTWGDFRFSLKSLLVPVAGLALAVTMDQNAPLALRDEQEQAKPAE